MEYKTIKVSKETYELLEKLKRKKGINYGKAIELSLKEKYGDKNKLKD